MRAHSESSGESGHLSRPLAAHDDGTFGMELDFIGLRCPQWGWPRGGGADGHEGSQHLSGFVPIWCLAEGISQDGRKRQTKGGRPELRVCRIGGMEGAQWHGPDYNTLRR